MKKKNKQVLTPEQTKAVLATIYQELVTIFTEMDSMSLKKKKAINTSTQKVLKDLETVLKAAFDHVPSENDAPLFSILDNNA